MMDLIFCLRCFEEKLHCLLVVGTGRFFVTNHWR